MNVFWILNGKKIKKALIVFMALFFAAGVVYVEKENVTVFSYQGPSAIYSVDSEEKKIALTFDISWGEERLEPILSILEEKGVQDATFFLSSPWSQDHPELVQKIVDAGFEIGSHGHQYMRYSSLMDEEIREQIQTAHRILTQLTGKEPRLIRLPEGDFNQKVLQIANELNYTVIQWDTDAKDTVKSQTAEHIVANVLNHAHKGDIIRMHASDSAKYTHKALPIIIDKLRDQGYTFTTVSGLLAQTETHHQEISDTVSSIL